MLPRRSGRSPVTCHRWPAWRTEDATRTPRIPDESRYWIAAGVGYRWKALEINFSYAHSFVEDATINDTTPLEIGSSARSITPPTSSVSAAP
jgi:long-subunit fatty acid transport protein